MLCYWEEIMSRATWLRRSLSVTKSCNASMSRFMTCSWRYLMLCPLHALSPGSISLCTAESHLALNSSIRLIRLIADRRFPLMASSAIWCGQIQWMTKRPSTVTSRRTLSVTALTILARSPLNSYFARIAYLVFSGVIRSSKRAFRCTDGAPKTPFLTSLPSSPLQIIVVVTRIRPLCSFWRIITFSWSSMQILSRHTSCLKVSTFLAGRYPSSLKKSPVCSSIS